VFDFNHLRFGHIFNDAVVLFQTLFYVLGLKIPCANEMKYSPSWDQLRAT